MRGTRGGEAGRGAASPPGPRSTRTRYEAFGFRPAHVERPFALGSARGPVMLGHDTSGWLVNFDWTDNGLRPPFLDQDAMAARGERPRAARGPMATPRIRFRELSAGGNDILAAERSAD